MIWLTLLLAYEVDAQFQGTLGRGFAGPPGGFGVPLGGSLGGLRLGFEGSSNSGFNVPQVSFRGPQGANFGGPQPGGGFLGPQSGFGGIPGGGFRGPQGGFGGPSGGGFRGPQGRFGGGFRGPQGGFGGPLGGGFRGPQGGFGGPSGGGFRGPQGGFGGSSGGGFRGPQGGFGGPSGEGFLGPQGGFGGPSGGGFRGPQGGFGGPSGGGFRGPQGGFGGPSGGGFRGPQGGFGGPPRIGLGGPQGGFVGPPDRFQSLRRSFVRPEFEAIVGPPGGNLERNEIGFDKAPLLDSGIRFPLTHSQSQISEFSIPSISLSQFGSFQLLDEPQTQQQNLRENEVKGNFKNESNNDFGLPLQLLPLSTESKNISEQGNFSHKNITTATKQNAASPAFATSGSLPPSDPTYDVNIKPLNIPVPSSYGTLPHVTLSVDYPPPFMHSNVVSSSSTSASLSKPLIVREKSSIINAYKQTQQSEDIDRGFQPSSHFPNI